MFENDDKLAERFEKNFEKSSKRKKTFYGFDKNKVVNQVLDKSTIFELYELLKSKYVSKINGIIKAGKESVLFWAINDGLDIALKVYLVTTSNFKKRSPYLIGDPRFSKIKQGTKNLVYLWAQKEFRNLTLCYGLGIPVVKPIHVSKNILVLEFIGKNGIPSKTLLESKVNYQDYESAITLIGRLYKEAKLVHGDFSEFNVFKTKKGLVLFDFGSAVQLHHPNSMEFLKRDINNITKFFAKRGLTVENPSDVLLKVTR